MTPTQARTMLDKMLARYGEDIVLRRVVGQGGSRQVVDVTCRAAVKSPTDQQLVAGYIQTDSVVIISPTQIDYAGWPGGQPVGGTADARVPSRNRGDKCVIQGAERTIQSANPKYINGELVRIELRVTG